MLRAVTWLVAVTSLACGAENVTDTDEPLVDLVRTIEAQTDLATFLDLIEASPVRGTLEAPGPLTIFAPTDAAFAALPAGRLQELLDNPSLAGAAVLSHVTNGALTVNTLGNLDSFENGNNVTVPVDGSAGSPTIGGATLVRTDIRATNGVLHVVDGVIEP